MLKLKSLMPETIRRMGKLNESRVLEAKEMGLRKHMYINDFEVWFANAVKYACYTPSEICDIYKKYDCNDSHITSLFVACCKKVGWL